MSDLIDRQEAIDALNKLSESTYEVDYGVVDCDDAINAIAALPHTQPKQRTGKWILVTDNNGQHFVCNKCGTWRYHQWQKFCGECGAKMEGANNDT